MKKFSLFLCIISLIVFLPFVTGCSIAGNFGGSSQEVENINSVNNKTELNEADDFNYTTKDNKVTITGVKNPKVTTVNIPSTINGNSVVSLSGFGNCAKLETITIPSSVTSIDGSCFFGCNKLKKLGIENVNSWCSISFANINNHPFSSSVGGTINTYTTKDGKITFTELTSINYTGNTIDGCFRGCKNLESVSISSSDPSLTAVIGTMTFYGCTNLRSCTLTRVETIEDYAFAGCTSLTSITLPNTLKSIGDRAFSSSGLTSISVPSSVEAFGLREGAFADCQNLTSATLTTSIEEIPENCFSGCRKLTEFEITSASSYTLNTIGRNAFQYCTSLNKDKIKGKAILKGATIHEGNNSLSSLLS